tara:strand:+ start:577 stop:801 length:225 start_codon:yes stop_codon:yes gene_type:complete
MSYKFGQSVAYRVKQKRIDAEWKKTNYDHGMAVFFGDDPITPERWKWETVSKQINELNDEEAKLLKRRKEVFKL